MSDLPIGNFYLKHFGDNNRLERIWKIAQVDFKKRYYNDKFGLLWALINPLTQIALYYFVFTRVLNRGEDNFSLFLFSAIVMWFAFANSTLLSTRLLYDKMYLINNIQFNWLDLFTSHMISGTIGLLFNLMAYFFTLIILGASIGSHFFWFPLVLLTWYLVTAACCILLSLIAPVFEDIHHIWNVLLLVGLWVSGVFFNGEYYLDNYIWFSYINPFVGIILNTRACILEGNELVHSLLLFNFVYGLSLYGIAVFLFKNYVKKVIEKI